MKELDWRFLVMDILKELDLTQASLAKKCKVSQQTISFWKSRRRSPGVSGRHALRILAKKAKLNLALYPAARVSKVDGVSEDVLKFVMRLEELPNKPRVKILEMANFMMDKEM